MRSSRGALVAAAAGAAIVVAAALVPACTLTTSLDGLSGGPASESSEGGRDGATETGSSTASDASDEASTAGDAGREAGPNLVTDPGFETSCNDWACYGGDVVWASGGRSGQHDCRACKVDTTDDLLTFDTGQQFVPTPLRGETYHAEAWVRAVGSSALNVALLVRTRTSTNTTLSSGGSARTDLGTNWQKVETDFTVDVDGAAWLNFYVSVHGAVTGSCFEVDDFVIERIGP